MWVSLRLPSLKREVCTMTWIAEATWERSACSGICTSDIMAIVSSRRSVSSG